MSVCICLYVSLYLSLCQSVSLSWYQCDTSDLPLHVQDLMEVNSGVFNDRLRKVVKAGKKHIKQCEVSPICGFYHLCVFVIVSDSLK